MWNKLVYLMRRNARVLSLGLHYFSFFYKFFLLLLYTMNEDRHKILVAFVFSMAVHRVIAMCSSWTRWKYDDWPPFRALWKCENEFFIGAILWRFTKPTMPTLELVKNGRVDVLSPMSSNYSMTSILTEFENIYRKI